MAVSIQIIVDDEQKVQVIDAGSNPDLPRILVEILAGWKQQANEPCAAGKKCQILQQWISQIERLLE